MPRQRRWLIIILSFAALYAAFDLFQRLTTTDREQLAEPGYRMFSVGLDLLLIVAVVIMIVASRKSSG